MLRYELSSDVKLSLKERSRVVQGAIATIANKTFGIEDPPNGIFKCEGGVEVNGREIAIQKGYVIDDWSKPREPSPEEIAVVDAIKMIEQAWAKDGEVSLDSYLPVRSGDPLRMMFS